MSTPVLIVSPAGVQGPRGNGILSGTGEPASSVGVAGDYYADTTNYPTSWVLYGPKTVSGWPATGLTVTSGSNVPNPLPVDQGGTGAQAAPAARTNLGLGTAATNNTSDFDAAGAAATALASANSNTSTQIANEVTRANGAYLAKTQNLADLANPATARANLRPWEFDVTNPAYGAKGDGQQVHDGAMGIGSAVLTSASGQFGNVVPGMPVAVKNAGTAASTTLITTVASVQSPNQITLNAPNASGGAVSNALVLWGHDDTAAVNAAVTAATAYAKLNGGIAKILFPPPVHATGFYVIAGAPTVGGTTKGNAQIPLPIVAATANKLTLIFEGIGNGSAFQHWQQTTLQTGCTLVSFGVYSSASAQVADVNANGNCSVIGGPTPPYGYGISPGVFTNVLPVLRNLSIRTTHSAQGLTWTAADFFGCAEANVENVTWGTTGLVADHDFDSPGVFGTGLSIGVLMPAPGNNDNCQIVNASCQGGYTFGIFLTEHCAVAGRIGTIYNFGGLCPVGYYANSVGSEHAINLGQASVEACQDTMYVIGVGAGGVGPFIYGTIDSEGVPSFVDNTGGTGLNALLGEVQLVGIVDPTQVNVAHSTGLKIRNGMQGYVAKTIIGPTTYTATVMDQTFLVDASGGNVTINLISAAWTPNTYTAVRLDNTGNTVTFAANGTEKINGAATAALAGQYSKLNLFPARVSGSWNWYEN